MAEDREPTEIALIQSNDQTLLVARSSGGGHFGVVCPSDLVPVLQSFVSTSNPSLIRFWKAYARSKGADTFFWDLIGIAEAIRDLSSVPRSRRLLHFTSEADLFHNSWQARLMRLCIMRGLDVEIIPASSELRRPDFRIQSDVAVEVKTLFSESGIEIDEEEGMRLAPPDADKLARNITIKVQDALGQVGQGGVIVVALWCDLAANAICRLGDTRPLDTIDLLPGTFVLALGPSEGIEPYAAVTLPLQDVHQFADRLSDRLRTHTKPVVVPFTSRHVCVARGNDWISIGRRVQIGNWWFQYAPYETPGNERGPSLIPPEVLELLFQSLKTRRGKWSHGIKRSNESPLNLALTPPQKWLLTRGL